MSFNAYHLKFLKRLRAAGARYLVIGGQARACYGAVMTRDMDIWLDIGPEGHTAAERVLLDWSAEHPLHCLPPLSPPLNLRRNVQIKFPDEDGCGWMTDEHEDGLIDIADGIDVLTSVNDLSFDEFYSRAERRDVGAGVIATILAMSDLPKMPPKSFAFQNEKRA